jgi:Tfp pilus assembly protein PilN
MNINILPRKSRIEKAFWPVMLLAVFIYAIIALWLVYTQFNNGASIEQKRKEISELQTDIQSLRDIRQPDPLAADFQAFQLDVQALKEFRRDWIEILQRISAVLPGTSRVISIQVNELGELKLESQFADLQQIAEYIATLSQYSLFESVHASSVIRTGLNLAVSESEGSSYTTNDDLSGLINNGDTVAKEDKTYIYQTTLIIKMAPLDAGKEDQ